MIDAGAFRNSPKRVVVKAVDQMLAAPDLWASPRTVTTVEELDALPVGSVIRDGHTVVQRVVNGIVAIGVGGLWPRTSIRFPASVLYVPSEAVES